MTISFKPLPQMAMLLMYILDIVGVQVISAPAHLLFLRRLYSKRNQMNSRTYISDRGHAWFVEVNAGTERVLTEDSKLEMNKKRKSSLVLRAAVDGGGMQVGG